MSICAWLIVMLMLLLPLQSQAKIKDGISCATCHTMHNSQDNISLTADAIEGLLNNSCIGCHTGINTNPTTSGTPFVFDPAGPTYGATGTSGHDTLAGGNFYWVKFAAVDKDRKGHNVLGIAADDALYGVGGSEDAPGYGGPLLAQLTCAGANGCHGNGAGTEIESLMPAHHVTDITPLDGLTVAQSYRFLSGVQGIEDSDWEFTVSADDHNQYKGDTSFDDDGSGTKTITSKCVGCHGYYHGQYSGAPGDGGASIDGAVLTPWVRHPTDIDIAAAEYNSTEYDNYTSYEPIAPVASSAVPLVLVNNTVQTVGNGIVTCVTCHRAHGSPYDAMLRWNYKGWPDPTCTDCDGCQFCHSNKN
jgi:predicted CXXCH cytochrome family protein